MQCVNLFKKAATRYISMTIMLLFSFVTFQSIAHQTDAAVTPIKRAVPLYPKYAIKKRIEGTVLVNFSIEQDGNVSDIQVVASDQDGLFDASAILGVQKWLYTKPAQKIRNNYAAIEFALTDTPATSQFTNVEKIQVRGE